MALLSPPATAPTRAPARTGSPLATRLTARTSSTPGRLTVLMVVLAALAIAAGLAAVIGVVQRSSHVHSVIDRTGPLTVDAQELYRSLSDADAIAANAFLSNGQEPAALRTRYDNDIAAASAALTSATAADPGQPAVQEISAQLPVYAGLVETARTYNRLNLPVGAAYLREASALMRDQLLTAAKRLYDAETTRFDSDADAAAGFPWLAIALSVLALAGLGYAQVTLTRRTNRLFNLGLVGATAMGLAALIWLGSSWLGARGELASAQRDGSAQEQVLARARIDALQARADEALTLVARGNGASFDTDYGTMLTDLVGKNGDSGLLHQAGAAATDPTVRTAVNAAISSAKDWRTTHQKADDANKNSEYTRAVTLTIGDDPASSASSFNHLDQQLAAGIAATSATLDRHARSAAGALAAAPIGLAVLTVLLLVGMVAGLQQRIAEYR
ncbi:hypothetical protein GCM10023322_81350 [Rugosimonospora acidiphila]|uniref:Secreted protein n=2 Tax=Rugosimonospora acidiphila TaxID=556531 RepID=A0ABP9SSY8_9ACTN